MAVVPVLALTDSILDELLHPLITRKPKRSIDDVPCSFGYGFHKPGVAALQHPVALSVGRNGFFKIVVWIVWHGVTVAEIRR